MKTLLKTAALVALSTGFILAQQGGAPPDPATMIANQVSRLTTLLDLTTAQATQISSILTTAQSSISTLQTTLQTDQTALATAITGNTTTTIDSEAATIGALQGQILDIQSKAQAAVYALLTSTQQTKLNTLGGTGALGGGPGPGRGGPGGPPPGGPGGPQ